MNEVNYEKIRLIYARLGDEISRRIFVDRLMFSLTEDGRFLRDCVATSAAGQNFLDMMKKLKSAGRKIIAYGAGIYGNEFYPVYRDYIDFYVDGNPEKKFVGTLPVYPPEVLKDYTDSYVLLAFGPGVKQGAGGEEKCKTVRQYLRKLHFPEEQIIDLYIYGKTLLAEAYFDLPSLRWKNGGTFIDAGCFDGYSSIRYLQRDQEMGNTKPPTILAFEAVSSFIPRIEENLSPYRNQVDFHPIPFGCWDRTGSIRFHVNESGMFFPADDGEIEVNCTTIDEALGGSGADFIKMDIEGSEYHALIGAKETIRRYKPQLAICIYHKPEDIIQLPELILEYNPSYTLFLRHYTTKSDDTVLYAVPES